MTDTPAVIKGKRWKAYFLFNPSAKSEPNKFGLKSRKCPPIIEELRPFEEDLFAMAERISFRTVRNDFQDKLTQDTKKIRESNRIFVPADKTRNMYEFDKGNYSKLLWENITKSYCKADENLATKINS